VRIQFNLGALFRFLLLVGALFGIVFIIGLVQGGDLSVAALILIVVLVLAVCAFVILFRLPIFARLGMYKSGARITTSCLMTMEEDTEGKEYILYQHAFFSYQLGNFTEALSALDGIDPSNVPDDICPMVTLNRGLVLEALFRAREAEETLQDYDVTDYNGRTRAFWLAYLANAKAGLGLDLEEALHLAESAFTAAPSAKIATVMGHILWRMEHHEAASSWFAWALKRMPRKERHFKSYTFFLQGRVRRDLGDEIGAEEALHRALKSAPSRECRDLYLKNWKGGARRRRRAPARLR